MTKPKQELVHAGQQPMQAQSVQMPPQEFSFEQMQRMAHSMAKSGLFGIKDVDQALSLMYISHAEGKHPALVARDYSIIQGRPAKNSEAILRDFQASGGRVEWHQRDDKAAKATFTHPISPKPITIEWDMARAEKAGLAGKDMYKKYPRQMLSSRCISEGCRASAPQATSGFHTPEETADFDPPPTDAPTITAIEQTVAAASVEPGSVEWYVNSMDIDVSAPDAMAKLQSAFTAAWESTKDKPTREKYKGIYEGQKEEIAAAAKPASEPQS